MQAKSSQLLFSYKKMLPTDVVDVVMSFHEPWPFSHTRLMHEFKELVAGRPWTSFSMLWMDWFNYYLDPTAFEDHLGLI